MDLWSLPPNLSTYGGTIDTMYRVILVITGIAFVLVEAGILWFLFRYRARDGQRATYTHGSDRLEVSWTVFTAAVVVFLGIWGGDVWAEIKGEEAFPEDAVELSVSAKQFEWNVTYPGADEVLGTDDDFTMRNDLRVPVDEPVVVNLTAEDVIHSFFLPYLRVKQDVVPGMTTRTWFVATDTAHIQLACAELCGLGHYRMRADVEIVPGEEFRRWLRERSAATAGNRGSDAGGQSAAAGSGLDVEGDPNASAAADDSEMEGT